MIDLKVYENLTARQQLNLFRGLYYNDGNATEKGIIANAINEILPEYNRQRAEIERLKIELKAMRGAANSFKADVKRLHEAEVKRMLESAPPLLIRCDIPADELKEMMEEVK